MADNPRIEDLKRRVQSDPASIAFAALAEEYRRAGQYEEAIATCRAGLQRHPAYLSAHVTLGRALIEVSRFDEAREELEHVLKIAPENLAAIRGLAEIHERRGELADRHHDYNPSLNAARLEPEPDDSAATPAPAPAPVPAPIALRPPVQPVPVHQAAAPAPTAAPPAPPAPESVLDPALVDLEAFLAAILRAREELEKTASDGR